MKEDVIFALNCIACVLSALAGLVVLTLYFKGMNRLSFSLKLILLLSI